ncbi:LacI family DNA-binding transcriptional regulator [Lactobacillus corticis]|uniref:LacI family transcriptional regulator n=1 Tax=Lactobacillus corticis TaxID=2201249 RepID=A0A916VHL3_9LACO|nr:LacI family DNA-binding transcriptional regulator [Lactobacillus corticis]GFZ26443.1 LacI family transcriptional regulator [Lactobacillus corticis]
MVTLSDVAKEANVSKMTVSRAINHPEQVTPELLELVEKAMDKLHYRPNSAARALVNNRTNVVKFITLEDIDTTEPYYMNLLFGVARGLTKEQYALQLVTDIGDIGKSGDDGYIITGARQADYDLFDAFDKPFILYGENRHGYDYVDTDNSLGEKIATKYALERGYEHVVFIGLDVKEPFEYSRENGYLSTMQQAQMPTQIYRAANHSHQSKKVVLDNWEKFPQNTCFVCGSDRLAVGIIWALLEKQVKIPEEYGVIGFDGVFLDQVSNPKITTIKQPTFEMGEILAQMLLQKIKLSGAPQGEVLLEPKLVVRDTTK